MLGDRIYERVARARVLDEEAAHARREGADVALRKEAEREGADERAEPKRL